METAAYDGFLKTVFEQNDLEVSYEISNVFLNADLINNDYDFSFLGYSALSEDEIGFEYSTPFAPMSFFGAYKCKTNFILQEGMEIYFEDTLINELEDSISVNDISKFFPLFKFQGDYIVIDIRKETYGALITIIDGHIGTYLAPSLMKHLIDLLDGLNERKYQIIDGELVYPST